MPVSAGTAYLDVAPRIHRTFSRDLQAQMVRPMGRAADDGGKQAGQQFSKRLADAGDRAGIEGGRRFSKRFGVSMRTGLGPVRGLASGLGGQLAAAFGGVAIAAGLKSVIDEAREAAKVGRQTAAVLKATGGVARVSAKDVDRLADSLSRKVGVDDEIIASGANMLLTFKGVRNEVGRNNDIFNQASSVILDMTAAMHQGEISQQGLEKATIQVGKALNDPIRGITALTRVGVTFDEGQKKQIKTLVESGRKMEAQKIILGELRSEFGGAAKAAADPWQRLGVALDNVKERIGTSLLPAFSAGASMLTDQVLPAVDRLWRQFQADLRPELGRVRIAWDDNKGAILGFVGSLTGSQSGMDSSADAARGLADALEQLITKSGQAAEVGDRVGDWLNRQNAELQDSGHRINEGLVEPWARATQRFGEFFGLRPLPQLQGLADRMTGVHEETDKAAVATDKAATAADRHAAALRNQRVALDALKGAMRDEETAELDLRQAKLNVTAAQKRLNDLKAAGKKGSTEYAQAQLDLRRAQIDVRDRTEAYRLAQQKANAATTGAMMASQQARPQVARLGDAAKTGGSKAGDARIPWRKLGEDVSATYRQIRNKTANITANFGWRGLEVFRVGGGTGGGLKAFAAGGRIARGSGPTADDVLIRASRGETVVSARDSSRPEFQAWASQRGIPGFATGGRIPNFRMQGAKGFVGALARWDDQVTKVLDLAASRFKRLAARLGNPAVQSFIRSTDPLPYIWGGAGPGGYDCSGLVGAVYGKHAGRGGGHGQRYFTTASISATGGLKPGLGGVLNIGVTPGQGHMAGSYGGLGFEARSTRSGIIIGPGARDPASFARHFHMAGGGLVDRRLVELFAQLGGDIGGDAGRLRINGKVFDSGGWLMPGTTVAVNRTGRPEPVGIDEDRLARKIAAELAKVIPTTIAIRELQAGMNWYAGRMGQAPPFR